MTTAVTGNRLRPADIGKPRLRGWLHAYAFFVAAVCGIVLCSLGRDPAGLRAVRELRDLQPHRVRHCSA